MTLSPDTTALLKLADVARVRESGAARFTLSVPSFTVAAGERVAIVGPSGSGKSTLTDMLALALAPSQAGTFTFAAEGSVDIAGLWQRQQRDRLTTLRGRHIGYVLQTGGLLGFQSVGDNIRLPLRLSGLPDSGQVTELARRLGLADQLSKKPSALSIGQRQRVAIARAVVHRPALVLADEPTSSLDPDNATTVMELFVEQVVEHGAAAVLVTHDAELAERHGFRLVRLVPDGSGRMRLEA